MLRLFSAPAIFPVYAPRLAALLLALLCASVARADDCALDSIDTLMQKPELRGEEAPAYPLVRYRYLLLRYVRSYYSRIADDLVDASASGEYLATLHQLMGSAGEHAAACTAIYRALLNREHSADNFALALWDYRYKPSWAKDEPPAQSAAQPAAPPAEVRAAGDSSGTITVVR